VIPDNHFTILYNSKQYLPIQTILTNTKQLLPIPNNTRQYLTNLVLVGFAWHLQSIKEHSQYNSSIVKVSSQYSSEGFFLSVWYHHGADYGDFHKTFDAY
jgi:hypothetical protein